MDIFNSYIVTAVIFAPLLGAGVIAFIPSSEQAQLKAAALVAMLVTFGLSLWMYLAFQVHGPQFQLELHKSWIESLGVSYHVGVDGVAATLMLLTGFLGPIVVLAAWHGAGDRAKEFCIALLVLQTAMLGSFAALDLILFYVFWEAGLIPMYLLIGVFGSDNRIYAAVKFFLFTMVGSMLMLVGIIYLYWQTGSHGGARTFDYAAIMQVATAQSHTVQVYLFIAFAAAFAVKVPMWPLHTWLPDAHTEAPVAGSIVLAGVMLKMGTFGFMRYAMPLFPIAARDAAPWIGILAVIGIIYGSLMSFTQRDMKRLVAYSSVAHLGFVMLGLAALDVQASTGAVYQMVSHGVSTGALFLLIGVIYERRHTRLISEFGGLAKVAPMLAAAFVVITLSSIALPGTNGFVGEFLILSGTFVGGHISAGTLFAGYPSAWVVVTILATSGVILGAVYLLYLVQRLFFGPLRNPRNEGMADLNLRELFAVVPLVLVAVGMGLFPQPFLDRIAPAAEAYTLRVTGVSPAAGSAQVHDYQPAPLTAPTMGTAPAFFGQRRPTQLNAARRLVVKPALQKNLRPAQP